MNTQSNVYTVVYSAIMVVVVAAALTLVSVGLKDRQVANEENEKRGNILKAAGIESTDIAADFEKYVIGGYALDEMGNIASEDKAAAFKADKAVFKVNKDGENLFVVPLSGNGLWDKIWGFAALKSDFNTISGVVFDHKGETPGLGAEMTNPTWQAQFVGKVMSENGEFKGVKIYKSNAATLDPKHGVDAITGSTMTSNGVEAMVNNSIKFYENFKNTLGQTPAIEQAPIQESPVAEESTNVNE